MCSETSATHKWKAQKQFQSRKRDSAAVSKLTNENWGSPSYVLRKYREFEHLRCRGNHQSSTCWWSCRKAVKWTTEVGLFPASKSFVNTRLPYLHITIIVERFWLFLNPGSYHRFYCLLEIYVRTLMNVSITSQTATQMRSAVMFTHCHTAISSPWLLTTAASLKHRSILDYHSGKYVVFYCRAVFSISSYFHRLCIEVFVFTNCQLYLSFFPP